MTDGAPSRCPKDMRFGPCGGVHHDLTCEVDRRPCPFVAPTTHAVPPPGPAHDVPASSARLDLPPVMVDVRYPREAPPASEPSMRRWWADVARSLHGCAALLGEHADNPVAATDAAPLDGFTPVRVLSEHGVPTVATVTGRNRTTGEAGRVIAGLASAGATAVHCVTGDHPAVLGIRGPTRFGAESITLLGAAAAAGAPATVAESPSSPGDRVGRLRWKQRAGAVVAVLNHSGDPDLVIGFADRCHDEGVDLPLVAPVPLVADVATARALEAFPGLHLPAGFLRSVAAATDPRRVGLELARELTATLAASGRFVGVNLSGGTTSADPAERAALTAEFAPAVRESWTQHSSPGTAPAEASAG